MTGIFGTLVGASWLDPLAAVAVGLMVSSMGFEVRAAAVTCRLYAGYMAVTWRLHGRRTDRLSYPRHPHAHTSSPITRLLPKPPQVAKDAILTLADASSSTDELLPRVQDVLGATPELLTCSDVRLRLLGSSAFVEAKVAPAATTGSDEAVLTAAVTDLERRLLALQEVADVRLSYVTTAASDAPLPAWWELPVRGDAGKAADTAHDESAETAALKEGRRRVVAHFPELGMPRTLIFPNPTATPTLEREIAEIATGAKKTN
jgi:hypothetical protein